MPTYPAMPTVGNNEGLFVGVYKHRVHIFGEIIVFLQNNKMTKIPKLQEKFKPEISYQWGTQKIKHIKRMVNNCHIPDLI